MTRIHAEGMPDREDCDESMLTPELPGGDVKTCAAGSGTTAASMGLAPPKRYDNTDIHHRGATNE
ncbi:hypothetical protein GCM10010112_84570 [Actinoplanes lobatus]|uniref:Uncharacterized protein n=1 Tax=Actinoplanes lobatus TaxID=113568 RepID=A0ABQ4AX54_9ACTN|nr:hypothetical protein GCM10010112_84570 [Actinoplanes lobatus]GIE45595.1 hypothetical protein Alo02nite_84930 [Actinoplanes lobatus]